jgi:hypothetical protein
VLDQDQTRADPEGTKARSLTYARGGALPIPRDVKVVASIEGRKVAPMGVELRECLTGRLRVMGNRQTVLVPRGAGVLPKTFPNYLTKCHCAREKTT